MKSSPTSTTSQTSSSVAPWLANLSQSYTQNAVGGLPQASAYTGPNQQAATTGNQNTAYNLAGSNAGTAQGISAQAQPTLQNAMGFTLSNPTASGVNSLASQLGQGTNSQLQAAINANTAENQNQTAQGLSQINNTLAGQGAFGGSRTGVADSNYAAQMALGNNQTNANLINSWAQNNQNTALGMLNQNNTNALNSMNTNLAGATGQANLGNTIANQNTNDIANLASTGATSQGTNTATNTNAYNNWLQQYQLADTQATTGEGLLAAAPNDTTGTSAQQSQMYSSLLGPAMIGLSLFSDRRLKEQIVKIGELPNGCNVYVFAYKEYPDVKIIGLMADEVQEWCPEAVRKAPNGYLAVRYDVALKKAFEHNG